MKTLLLIDTHALLHRFYHALPPLTAPNGEHVQAIYGIAQVLLKFLNPAPEENTHIDYMAGALDRPEPTFRADHYADYKIHRPAAAETLISQIKKLPPLFDAFGIRTLSAAGFEADDILGTLAEKFKNEPDLMTVIISGDLDLLQLVEDEKIAVDIIKSGTNNMVHYTEAMVKDRFGVPPAHLPDYKGLVGDTSDNIPGVKGIGPKNAKELLGEFGTLENIYENTGLIKKVVAEKLEAHRDMAFSSKMLGTIRRDAPINISSLNDLRTQKPDREKLAAYFKELGFESLVRRM